MLSLVKHESPIKKEAGESGVEVKKEGHETAKGDEATIKKEDAQSYHGGSQLIRHKLIWGMIMNWLSWGYGSTFGLVDLNYRKTDYKPII